MRLAPLIPLAVLGVGVLAVEILRLRDAGGDTTSPLLIVRDASITTSNDQATVTFIAGKLEIGDVGAQATEVVGEVDTQGTHHRFVAGNLEQKTGVADLVLDGNVELWHEEFHIHTDHATISRNGEVRGTLATISGPQGQSRADIFLMTEDGTTKLEGNVRALITSFDE